MAGTSVKTKTMPPKRRKPVDIALQRNLLSIERAILLGRLAVLERELDTFICLQELDWGRVYIEWWVDRIRKPVILRLLDLNRQLGINVRLPYRKI